MGRSATAIRVLVLIPVLAVGSPTASRAANAPTPGATVSPPAQIVEGGNTFALDLYSELHTRQGNLFFSPESISLALAMTAAGARGETATAMQRTLHLPQDPARAQEGAATLSQALANSGAVPGASSPSPTPSGSRGSIRSRPLSRTLWSDCMGRLHVRSTSRGRWSSRTRCQSWEWGSPLTKRPISPASRRPSHWRSAR